MVRLAVKLPKPFWRSRASVAILSPASSALSAARPDRGFDRRPQWQERSRTRQALGGGERRASPFPPSAAISRAGKSGNRRRGPGAAGPYHLLHLRPNLCTHEPLAKLDLFARSWSGFGCDLDRPASSALSPPLAIRPSRFDRPGRMAIGDKRAPRLLLLLQRLLHFDSGGGRQGNDAAFGWGRATRITVSSCRRPSDPERPTNREIEPARLLRPRLSLAGPPPLAPLRLRCLRLRRRATSHPALHGRANQRLMQTAPYHLL